MKTGEREVCTYREDEEEVITEEGREEGSQEQCEVVEEAPSKRRNTRKGLEIKEEVQRKETGANTQVAEKVKRVEERLKREKGEKEKIQPTLRSFMDLRSGLLGPCGKTGHVHFLVTTL